MKYIPNLIERNDIKDRVDEMVSILNDDEFKEKLFRLCETFNPTTMTIQNAINFVNSQS